MAENNRKWFISGKPNENDYMDWWNAYNNMDDSTSLEDANTMTNEWNEGSWNNGKDAATTYRNNGISFSQFAESPAGKFLLSRPRAREGIKESYGLSDKVGELLDKGDINTAMELAKQEEQNNNTEVLKEEKPVPGAKVEGNTDNKEAVPETEATPEATTQAESNKDNKKAAKEKKNYIAELGKVIAKGAELGKAKGAELGKAIAKGAKKIANSDIYKDYVYGNSIGSVNNKEYGKMAKKDKESNAVNFLANEYPSLLTSVFSRKSGKNMGQRLAGLGELLATLGANAANGALAGFHGRNAPDPVVGRQAQMYNRAYNEQIERDQKVLNANLDAKVEYTDKLSRVNRTPSLKDAPSGVKSFVADILGAPKMDFDSFLEANERSLNLMVKEMRDDYNSYHKIMPFEKLGEKKEVLLEQWYDFATKKMKEYYNGYLNAHSQYEAGLKKQGIILANTSTELANTGTELSNAYKELENYTKTLSNEQQKQDFIKSIEDRINGLRSLKYNNIKDKFNTENELKAGLINAIKGIYTKTSGGGIGGNASVGIKGVATVGGEASKNVGYTLDSLANMNIEKATEFANRFTNITGPQIKEWDNWIDTQIKYLEGIIRGLRNQRVSQVKTSDDILTGLGFDGKTPVNKDFDHYRQILMG